MSSSISSFEKQRKRAFFQALTFLFFLFFFDRLLFVAFRKAESLYYGSYSPSPLADKFAAAPYKGEYQVMILGTSRTYNGIHPAFIWDDLKIRAFKEAYVGKGPMYNYFFYQDYKKFMGIPRVVIYGVDYFLFQLTSERQWMKRFNEIQADSSKFLGRVSLLLANKPRLDEFTNTFLNDPHNDIDDESRYRNERDLARIDAYRGTVSRGRISDEEPLHYRKIGFARFPGEEGMYFARLIDELQKDRVQVLLVALPEYIGTYLTNYSQRKFQSFFTKFAKARPGVFFYNYDLPRKFDLARADFFINGGYGKANSHLSKAGSEVFNRLLLHDLRRHLGAK